MHKNSMVATGQEMENGDLAVEIQFEQFDYPLPYPFQSTKASSACGASATNRLKQPAVVHCTLAEEQAVTSANNPSAGAIRRE